MGVGAAVQHAVDAPGAGGRGLLEEGLAAQGRLQVGHQQRGGQPLAGHVAQGQGQVAVAQRDEVEVVAPHVAGRHAHGRQLVAGCVRRHGRQQPLLDLLRHAQLLAHALVALAHRVEARVLDNLRRLHGDDAQQALVLLVEAGVGAVLGVLVVDREDADHLRPQQQRHAEQGVHGLGEVVLAQALVVVGIVGEQGLAVVLHPALQVEVEVVALARDGAAHGAADRLGGVEGVPVHQRDHRLVGAGGAARTVDDPVQDVLGIEGPADLGGELVQHRQFRDGAPQGGVARLQVVVGRRGGAGSVVFHGSLPGAQHSRWTRG